MSRTLTKRASPLDHLIDDVMLYCLPNTGPNPARFYREGARKIAQGIPTAPVPVPAGISMVPGEQVRLPRRRAGRRFADLVHCNELPRGGHFAALEQASLFVAEVRSTFRGLR